MGMYPYTLISSALCCVHLQDVAYDLDLLCVHSKQQFLLKKCTLQSFYCCYLCFFLLFIYGNFLPSIESRRAVVSYVS